MSSRSCLISLLLFVGFAGGAAFLLFTNDPRRSTLATGPSHPDPRTSNLTPIEIATTEWSPPPKRELVDNAIDETQSIVLEGAIQRAGGGSMPQFSLRCRVGNLEWSEESHGGAGGFQFAGVGDEEEVTTNEAGRFSVTLPRFGQYEIRSDEAGWSVEPPLVVSIERPHTSVEITVVRSPRVTIEVREPTGSVPLDAMNVHIYPITTSPERITTGTTPLASKPFEASLTEDGSATFLAVPRGKYFVTILGADVVAMEGFEILANDVTLSVTLPAPQHVSLYVQEGSTRTPIESAIVTLNASSKIESADGARAKNGVLTLETDSSGRTLFSHRSEFLQVTVKADDYSRWEGFLTQPDAQEIVVTLSRPATPVIQVVDRETGRPIVGAEVEFIRMPRASPAEFDSSNAREILASGALLPGMIRETLLSDETGSVGPKLDLEADSPMMFVAARASGYASVERTLLASGGDIDRTFRLGRSAELLLDLPDSFRVNDLSRVVIGAQFGHDKNVVRWRNGTPQFERKPTGLSFGGPSLASTSEQPVIGGLSAGDTWYFYAESPLCELGTIRLQPGMNRAALREIETRGVRFTIENWREVDHFDIALLPAWTQKLADVITRDHQRIQPLHRVSGPEPVEISPLRPGRYRIVAYSNPEAGGGKSV